MNLNENWQRLVKLTATFSVTVSRFYPIFFFFIENFKAAL
jgi:hypothetical protein